MYSVTIKEKNVYDIDATETKLNQADRYKLYINYICKDIKVATLNHRITNKNIIAVLVH